MKQLHTDSWVLSEKLKQLDRFFVVEMIQADKSSKEEKHAALSELLKRLMEWSSTQAPSYFDETFLHSMFIQHHENKFKNLTTKQVDALIRIATKFDVQ